jgi:hypothetical protein
MNSPIPDKVAETVKVLGTEMKDAIDILSKKVEGAIATLGEEVDRLTRMLRGAQAIVQIEAEAFTEMGESVMVVGNHPTLGGWNPEQALKLDSAGYPKWTARVVVPIGTTLEYKYVRKNADGSLLWEASEGNRVVTTGTGGPTTTHDQVRWG